MPARLAPGDGMDPPIAPTERPVAQIKVEIGPLIAHGHDSHQRRFLGRKVQTKNKIKMGQWWTRSSQQAGS